MLRVMRCGKRGNFDWCQIYPNETWNWTLSKILIYLRKTNFQILFSAYVKKRQTRCMNWLFKYCFIQIHFAGDEPSGTMTIEKDLTLYHTILTASKKRVFENIVGKGENAGKQAFSPFPTMFSKAFCITNIERQDCIVKI